MRIPRFCNRLLPVWIISIPVALAFFLGAALARTVQGNEMPTVLQPEFANQAQGADRAGIEELHRKDVAATLASDPKLLAELWTEDAVRMEPGKPAEIGLATIHANDEKEIAANPAARMLSYRPDIKNLQIVGDWAVEWDNFEASYKDSPQGKVVTFHAKALRVLRKQPDSSWKFSRVMWNLNE